GLRALAQRLDQQLCRGQPAGRGRRDQGPAAAVGGQGRGARGEGQARMVRGHRLPAATLSARGPLDVDAVGRRGAQEDVTPALCCGQETATRRRPQVSSWCGETCGRQSAWSGDPRRTDVAHERFSPCPRSNSGREDGKSEPHFPTSHKGDASWRTIALWTCCRKMKFAYSCKRPPDD